jgi:hypothetical protein
MAKLDLSQLLAALANKARNSSVLLGNGLQRMQDAINNLGQQLAAEPIGSAQAPPVLESVNVKTAGEIVHVTLTHNVPINKNIHYFVEFTQNDPNFLVPLVEHLGTSRQRSLNLPTRDDGGDMVNYYFRGLCQYPGSQPSPPINYGGISPSAVTLSGSTELTLLPSPGSGTGASNGQQGGWGFGKTNTRAAIGPKRQIPA